MTALAYRPPERSFLGLPAHDAGPPGEARAVIIPFPLEATVSYGRGTSQGPEAIIAASPELEFFDEEFWCEPFRRIGIATLEVAPPSQSVETALREVEALARLVLEAGRFPLILGGEHSITAGAIRPVAARFPGLVVLQIDAHADLRDSYLGSPFSHASAMRRVLDHQGVSLVSLGIRAISAEEIPFLEANRHRIHMHFAKDKHGWSLDGIMAPLAGRPVYLTFDVDGLDASLMPATGTPEPGGLFFDEAVDVIRAAARAGTIVGADVVELAPIPGLHACDFTAAKLAYKIIAHALLART